MYTDAEGLQRKEACGAERWHQGIAGDFGVQQLQIAWNNEHSERGSIRKEDQAAAPYLVTQTNHDPWSHGKVLSRKLMWHIACLLFLYNDLFLMLYEQKAHFRVYGSKSFDR